MRKKLTVIVPCYNEELALPYFYNEINKVSKKLSKVIFEIIFVDDGSTDKTLEVIKEMIRKDKRIRFISFSRNFGKEAAMYAGLSYATGEYITIMDADLQDPPEMLIEMYDNIKNGEYDCIGTRRISRKGEPVIRSFFAKMFYKIINKMSKIEMVDGARDFRLMTRKMVNAILSLKEYNRYSKGLFSYVGFKTKWLEYKNIERVAGKSKWNFLKLFVYAIEGIVGFSTIPLILSAIIGLFFCLLSFIMIIVIIVRTLIWSDPVSGWPSLVCIILFVSGIQLFCIGIIGTYLSKIYLETKNRPIYVIKETEKD